MSVALEDLSIAQAGRALRGGPLTSLALTQHLLSRIEILQPVVNAFITVTAERALEDARRADAELAAGIDRGPMHGIPYGLKDVFDTEGIRTTCCSRLMLDNVPSVDSEVAKRLRDGGAVLLGKLTTHEFAQGGPSFDLPFPPTRNPWNTNHYTSGSSSGSATAVAARLLRLGMGSDGGGSIRTPAAYCGAVGLKPTFGLISRRGAFPLGHTMDHCGPITRTVEDAAIAMQVVAGHDALDDVSVERPLDYLAGLEDGVCGLRIGFPRRYILQAQGREPQVFPYLERVLDLLRAEGAIIVDVEFPDYELVSACGSVILAAEGFAVHEENFRVRPSDYGRLMMQASMAGATLTAADYLQAMRVRRKICAEIGAVLSRCDAIVTAGVLSTALRMDEIAPPFHQVSQNVTFNLTGTPALAVPIALADDGLPLSATVAGRAFDDALVLRIGRAIERASGWQDVTLPFGDIRP